MEQGIVEIQIDGTAINAKVGQSIAEAAREHGLALPTLCDYKSLPPAGTCRVCTVRIGGKFVPSCTTPVSQGMKIDNQAPDVFEIRKSLLEMLFVEGNHMCPSCEKSGNCELQHLAIEHKMTAPRFPFLFPHRKVDASMPHLLIEHNRCIQCLRCVRGIKAKDGHDIFGFANRGHEIQVTVDCSDPEALTESTAQKAMDICPVGALIKKRTAFHTPIGKRKYDQGRVK